MAETNTTNNEDLKPCPFCGSDKAQPAITDGWCSIICYGCGAKSRGYGTLTTMDQAVEAWNSRATEADLLKALQEMVNANKAFQRFEAENPNDSTKRWKAVWQARCAVIDNAEQAIARALGQEAAK